MVGTYSVVAYACAVAAAAAGGVADVAAAMMVVETVEEACDYYDYYYCSRHSPHFQAALHLDVLQSLSRQLLVLVSPMILHVSPEAMAVDFAVFVAAVAVIVQ